MKHRVTISTGSGLLAMVIRKTLARSKGLEAGTDHRDARGALAAVREPTGLAVVDAELLHDRRDGAALCQALIARRQPSIIVDARRRGVPEDVEASVVVVCGRIAGELDLGVIERELLAAVGSAFHHRSTQPIEPHVAIAPPPERAELCDAVLELIVLGVSTGGPTLLLSLLKAVTPPATAMLIVQHMPESETAGFAARLGEVTGLRVHEVAGGPLPPPGAIGVVRGGGDFRIVRRGDHLHLRPTVVAGNPFHPSIDEVLTSAVLAGVAVGAAILTGMGQDGAAGALAMARRGLPVIAQRPDTCAVAGMPQAAIGNGAACSVMSPEAIADMLNRWSELARRGAPAAGRLSAP